MAAEGILDLRYARALFAAAREAGRIDEVREGLAAAARAMGDDRDLARLLADPFASRARKRDALVAAAQDRGGETIARFVAVVVHRRRESRLPFLLAIYDRLVREARGVVAARVQAAVALSAEQKTRLVEALHAVTGKTVELEEEVQPGFLGGIRVLVGDTVYDGTLRRRLGRLRERWIETKV